ncbi:protein kinase [Histoplasma capsulatum G186AR]|uniref:Protein kinase n=1 Tax=Ajellomyces capsulatus TaxID=5037 RepID=A0A8H7Z0P1_AJECA|nr:protein kinase [Histoplasma capsulatum]QSS73072.1 protein kinase [Histoplasma capsulatum G186AR]
MHGDIHLRNILVKLPSNFDKLSVDEFYKKYGKPETVPVRREDGKPISPHIPSRAVKPLTLSNKPAWDFTLADARILLSDFGEAFSPAAEPRCGQDCHTPLPMRPPEAHFEPNEHLSYAADIWSLGVAIWEILGMKAIFSAEYFTADEIISQQIDVLGPMPSTWWEKWQGRDKFFDENAQPKEGRHVWPAMNTAFEEGVQKYRQKNPNMGVFSEEESAAILDLIRRMLVFRPEQRLSIHEVLKSEWMVKWALPEFERAKKCHNG